MNRIAEARDCFSWGHERFLMTRKLYYSIQHFGSCISHSLFAPFAFCSIWLWLKKPEFQNGTLAIGNMGCQNLRNSPPVES